MPGWEELSREQLLVVVAEQAKVIEEQASRIEALAAQVAELSRRLGQNSGNSSLPPSSDRFGKPRRERRGSSARKPGKQPGAPGSALERVADPDEVIEHVPAACGVRRLADRIRRQGGTARTLSITFTDSAEERAVIAELNAARDAEYAELLERLPELRKELAAEHARGNATYAEVEASEADLERFRTWLAKIAARDYFLAPGGEAARDAVEEAAAALAAFEEAALHAEAPEPAPAGQTPRMRAVDHG